MRDKGMGEVTPMAVMTRKEVMEEGVIGPQAGMTMMKIKGGILPTERMTLEEEVGHPRAPQALLEAPPLTQATSPVSTQKTWLRQIRITIAKVPMEVRADAPSISGATPWVMTGTLGSQCSVMANAFENKWAKSPSGLWAQKSRR